METLTSFPLQTCKCQEHDGLKVKREGKRKSENIKDVHALVSTKDSTSDCNLW